MNIRWTTWRRDLLIGLAASLLTASVLVPIGWAAVRGQHDEAEAARKSAREAALLAEQKAAEADEQRAQARRALMAQAADFAGFTDRSVAEIMSVSSKAIAPEVPEGARLLIDKKASSYTAGDIVVFKVGDRNYLGRVLAVDRATGRLTIGRNGEADREVAVGDVLGRGVLNTR